MNKELLMILVTVLIVSMSGCEKQTAQQVYYNYEYEGMLMIGCTDTKGDTNTCDSYIKIYTQSEVNELFSRQYREIIQLVMENYIQSYDGKLYTNCRIEDSIKVCDEIILKEETK